MSDGLMALHKRTVYGGRVETLGENHWMFRIPAGPAGAYRGAQLDDHLERKRSEFPWEAPARMELRARVSGREIPGTWGFGFWNDPFSMNFRFGGAARKLPALPNAAWFFNAAPPNYLAFHNDHPATGYLAATFRSPRIPTPLLLLGAPFAPLLLIPAAARLLRRAAGLLIRESGVQIPEDVTGWHSYRLDWLADCVRFYVDGQMLNETRVTPVGKLGLVIWVDNQYAAFPPSGKLKMGTTENMEEAWMELEGLSVVRLS